MGSAKRILSGIFWTTLGSLLNALYGFFSVPILLFHYGKADYGLIGLAFSVNVYLRLMDMGFSSGNVKFFSQWIAKKDYPGVSKLFQSSLVFYGVIGIINAVILIVVSYYSQGMFNLNNQQTEIIHNMFYVLMISAFFGWISALLDQFLKANEIIGWEQRLLICAKLLQVLILVLTVKYNYSVKTYFMLTTFSSLIVLPFSMMKIKTLSYRVSFMPKYYHPIFKQVLPYSLSIFSFSIFQFSANYLRPLILSVGAGVESVADYRILEGFANMVLLVSASFVGTMLPMASKAAALGDTGKQDKLAYDGTKYITIFLTVVTFGFILVSKNLMHVYVGDNYSYLVLWLNIWVLTLITGHTGALSSLVLAGNNMRPIVFMSAFSTITSLTIAWLLIPNYKVGGVVMGYMYYCIAQLVFYYGYYYKKHLNLNPGRILVKSFLVPAAIIALTAGVVYIISTQIHLKSDYLQITATGIVFCLLITPVVYFIVLTKHDKDFIKLLLVKKPAIQQ